MNATSLTLVLENPGLEVGFNWCVTVLGTKGALRLWKQLFGKEGRFQKWVNHNIQNGWLRKPNN